jgi:hypothetical protein
VSLSTAAVATDHAVFVPTSEGPVGGVVSRPLGEARAGVLLLQGFGRPARSGTNSFWTRLARELAGYGLVALRVDYSREGETKPIGDEGGVGGKGGQIAKHEFEMRLMSQVVAWFHERLDGRDLLLAGACSGARLAIDLAGGGGGPTISRTFLVVPYLRALVDPGEERQRPATPRDGDGRDDPGAVCPSVVEHMRAILGRGPSWLLAGEHDDLDVDPLVRGLGPTPHELDVEIVPGLALHFLDQPDVQEHTRSRLVDRVSRALAELGPAGSSPRAGPRPGSEASTVARRSPGSARGRRNA